MRNEAVTIAIIVLLALGTLGLIYIFKPIQAYASLDMNIMCGGTVDKKPGETFTVKINFKNKGTTEGIWKIAVTFEGDDWTWKGDERLLTLNPCEKETLVWQGNVPKDAAVDSIARLIVYYDNDFTVLNWWIHIIPSTELYIVYSKVT